MGSVHASKYTFMDDVELFAFDVSAERLEAFCNKFSAKPSASLAELIESVDSVDVCTPTDSHRDVALEAIAAGKPVFVEKPMARTLEQCAELIDAAKKAGVHLMPGQVVRFFPEFAAAHNAIMDGKVGNPAAVRMRRGGRSPKGTDLWFHDYERSGGILLDLSVHDFDWLLWTIGEVKSVYTRSVRMGKTVDGADMDGDYTLTILQFENGCVAHVESTWLDPSGFRTTFEVCGSDGMIEHDSRLVGSVIVHKADGSRKETNFALADDPYYAELRGFLDAVQNGTPVPVPPEDGMKAIAVAIAAIESAKTGKAVTL